MDLYNRIKHTVASQFECNHKTEESRIDGITYLVTMETSSIATQFAQYMLERGKSINYTEELREFIENHYGKPQQE